MAESKEERKIWIEVLQDQNPRLIDDPTHHARHIAPDTPQGARKHPVEVTPVPVVRTTEEQSLHPHMDYHRPGSPRHGLHRLLSSEGNGHCDADHLHLDIKYLNIAEGHSDNEEN